MLDLFVLQGAWYTCWSCVYGVLGSLGLGSGRGFHVLSWCRFRGSRFRLEGEFSTPERKDLSGFRVWGLGVPLYLNAFSFGPRP